MLPAAIPPATRSEKKNPSETLCRHVGLQGVQTAPSKGCEKKELDFLVEKAGGVMDYWGRFRQIRYQVTCHVHSWYKPL